MKKTKLTIWILALLLSTVPVAAQDIGGIFGPTRAIAALSAAFTTCTTATEGYVYQSTADHMLYVCNATAFVPLVMSGGAGGWPLLAPDGTQGAPSYSFSGAGTLGFRRSANVVTLGLNNSAFIFDAGSASFRIGSDTGSFAIGASADTFLTRPAAATVSQGAADAASQPVAQVRRVQRASGGSNTASSAETWACGGSGTGTAVGAQCIWQVGTPQASGATLHVFNPAMTAQDFGLANVKRIIITNPAGSIQEPVGNTAFVTSDFTTASGTFVTVTGLSFTMPANHAMNVPFSCDLQYSQATAVAANQFGIQDVTVAPTNIMVNAHVYTSTTVLVAGATNGLNTTAATALVTFTPSIITNSFTARIAGFIEQPSNAAESVINILVLTGNVADSITVKRGSRCTMGFS